MSYFGEEVKHLTNDSNDFVGEAAIAALRQAGIDVSAVKKIDHPLSLYFLDVGSEMRSSRIAYSRINGSFAQMEEDHLSWYQVLENPTYFHWTGGATRICGSFSGFYWRR